MAAAVVVVGVSGVSVKSMAVAMARWAVPLASAPSRSDRLARVCGGTVDTVNIGSRAPACPLFNITLRERGLTAIQGKRPRSGRGTELVFQSQRSFQKEKDHIPNILPLNLHISS
jgi:hypothetical protein